MHSKFDEFFYLGESGNRHSKVNFISDGEISASGAGDGSGSGGSVTIVDNLNSTSTDAALSANQGRVLKSLIDSKISSVTWDDINYKPTTFTPTAHTHSISDVTNLHTTLDAKASAPTANSHVIITTAHTTHNESTTWMYK